MVVLILLCRLPLYANTTGILYRYTTHIIQTTHVAHIPMDADTAHSTGWLWMSKVTAAMGKPRVTKNTAYTTTV